MYFLPTCIFYSKINKFMEVYSLPCRTTTIKSVNAKETERQASRASATNEDHNFVS